MREDLAGKLNRILEGVGAGGSSQGEGPTVRLGTHDPVWEPGP